MEVICKTVNDPFAMARFFGMLHNIIVNEFAGLPIKPDLELFQLPLTFHNQFGDSFLQERVSLNFSRKGWKNHAGGGD